MFDYNESLEQARERNVRDALLEDYGTCDWTGLLIPASRRVVADVRVRESAVLCGQAWFEACLRTLDKQAKIDWRYDEGQDMQADTVVCTLHAQARALLAAERPGLNFLQLLSATASVARLHVQAIAGASPNPRGCVVLDTRKTIPGLRQAQKYAVRVGGGANQRLALWHGILIKENHIAAAGGIAPVMQQAQSLNSGVDIQIEVESLDELQQALAAGAQSILIDNFSLADMREAVRITAGRALLEVSGGVTLAQLRDIAATGVDRISIGKLTKDIRAIDFSMRVRSTL
ncbi:MAG: carboxylating nicotinate-nucleotide diphosphorylase [Betaproteobacteria bacterium]|jgi:nicotinate-nucleotide pyrophosphorylase (carboxylating)|nr:carboxylating nicotinate-nucleotide diphosphorylase [Betaproteobacteria bacterium]